MEASTVVSPERIKEAGQKMNEYQKGFLAGTINTIIELLPHQAEAEVEETQKE